MSDPVPTASANPTTGAATDETRPTAVLSNNLCKHLAKMAMHEPTSLSMLPAELILDILGSLDMKRDWFSLARTCRRVSNVVVAELGKYNANEGNNYAFWYACVANKPTILLCHISLDATVVNRHFTCNFMNPRIKFAFGQFMSPLAVAIRAGRGGIVRLLLANGADANLPDREPASKQCVLCYPINWAVDSKHDSSVAIIKMLKDHSADPNQVPKDWGKRRDEYPKRMKCAPIFRLLMLDKPPRRPHSSQPTSCEMYDNDFKKIQDLRLRQLIALLESGADPNKRWDWDFVTPVFFLLASLAAYTPSFYFPNRLMLSHEEAAQASMVNDIVASFLDTLRDFGAHVHGLGNTYFYNEEEARAISAAYPETPLHAVCRLKDRQKPLIYWFLRNGTHIDVLGKASNTALMAYCGSNFKDTDQFQKFLRRRPVINHRDILGRTALHDLCANRLLQPQVKEKAVSMMLDAGADPTAVSDEKRDPTEELDFVTGSNNAYDEAANPTAVRNERRDSAQKIDPRIGRYDPHHTLREMLHNAAEKWKELKQKNEERLVLADKRPTNHRRGSRGGRGGGHANSRNENRVRMCGDEKVGHQSDNPARTRGGSDANNNKENQEDGPGDEGVGHQPNNRAGTRGGHRGGNRGNRGRGRDRGPGDHHNNHGQDTSRERRNESIPQQPNPTDTRGGFHQNIRDSRSDNGSRGCHQGNNNRRVYRGGIQGSSRGGRFRGNCGANRGGQHHGKYHQGDNHKTQVETPVNSNQEFPEDRSVPNRSVSLGS